MSKFKMTDAGKARFTKIVNEQVYSTATPIIQTNEEQKATTDGVWEKSFVCLAYVPKTKTTPWTWKVAMIVDKVTEADEWWENEKKPARVYYGNGYLRNAK